MKKYIFLALTAIAIFIISCQQDNVDISSSQEDFLETVSINQVTSLLNSNKNKSAFSKSSNLQIEPHYDKIHQQTIKNSDAKLTVVPVTTKYKNLNAKILYLKIGGKVQKVLYSKIPNKKATTNSFTGRIVFTKLNGELITLYNVENGIIKAGYKNKKIKSKQNKSLKNNSNDEDEDEDEDEDDCDENLASGEFCHQYLDEIELDFSGKDEGYIDVYYIYYDVYNNDEYSFDENYYNNNYDEDENGDPYWDFEEENYDDYKGDGDDTVDDDQIDFDPTFEDYPCQKDIVEYQHTNKSELAKFIMSAFGGDQNKVNLTYKVEDLTNPSSTGIVNAQTSNGTMDANQNLNLTITLDTQAAEKGSDLLIAAVIIHENVHALLSYMDGIVTFNISSSNPSLGELAEAYAKWKGNPNNPQQTTEATEHFYMKELVGKMADALQTYGESKGYTIERSYYEALCWSADMKEHAKNELHSAINRAYMNERLLAGSTDSEGNSYSKGKKCQKE